MDSSVAVNLDRPPDSSREQSTVEISVIAPTRNEVGNVERLVSRVHTALEGYAYELIIVDDASRDGTAALAGQLAASYPIEVVVRNGERGLASAVMTGFSRAKGGVLCAIDADLQHPPETIPMMYEAMKESGQDIVIASRHVDGARVKGWPARRDFASRVAKAIAYVALPKVRNVNDPLSGFFLVKRSVIEGVSLAPIGYKILLEILVRCDCRSVAEYPYVFVKREVGEAKLSRREVANYLKHVWRLRRAH